MTSDLTTGTVVTFLPGDLHYGISARTGGPGVGILSLGEVGSLIYNFYLSLAPRQIVSDTQCMLLRHEAANGQILVLRQGHPRRRNVATSIGWITKRSHTNFT